MPRRCTVCTHPDSFKIGLAIIRDSGSLREIARHYGLHHEALARHAESHIAELVKTAKASDGEEAIELRDELASAFATLKQLTNACSDWLTDPERPGHFYAGPRTSEVEVIYDESPEEQPGGEVVTVRRKARLSALLERVAGVLGISVVSTAAKMVPNPRETLMQALDKHLKYLYMVRHLGLWGRTGLADIDRERMVLDLRGRFELYQQILTE